MAYQPGQVDETGGYKKRWRERWSGVRALGLQVTHARLIAMPVAAPSLSGGSPGQIVALFAVSLLAVVALLGLIFDGGNLYLQRRTAQNAADAGSLAGTRALMYASTSPDPTVSPGESTIAKAICVYVTQNAFGSTPKATANFVGLDGNPLTPTTSAPNLITLPTDPSDLSVGPHRLKCDEPAVYNVIPPTAAGVKVDANINFNTYLVGMVGIPAMTTTGSGTVQGAAVMTADASNSPFIICGIDTALAPPAVGTHSVLAMLNSTTAVSPARLDPAAVGMTFLIHGPQVTHCGRASMKGLADQAANAGITSLPADLNFTNGTVAGPTRTRVDGYAGCAPGNNFNCVMMVPVATGIGAGPLQLTSVLWAAFLITPFGANQHFAQLLGGYSVGGGPESFTWTWSSSRTSAAITSIGATR